MANDLQDKSIYADGSKTSSITEQKPADISVISLFTPVQRRLLGMGYPLTLGWRREGQLRSKLTTAPVPPLEREA